MSGWILGLLIICLLPLALMHPVVGLLLYDFLNLLSPQNIIYSSFGTPSYSMWVGVVLILSFLIFENKNTYGRKYFVFLLAALTGWVFLTSIASDVTTKFAIDKQDRVLKTLCIAILSVFILRTRARIEAYILIVYTYIASSAILNGVRAAVTGGGYGMVENQGKIYQESSVLSMFMVVGVPLTIYLQKHCLFIPRHKLINLGYLGLIGLFVISLYGLHARTGIVCAFILAVLLFVKSRQKMIFLIAMIFIASIAPAFLPESFALRIGDADSFGQDQSAVGRLDAWRWGWEYALNNPILGGGFGVYEAVHKKAAHNWFFEILGEHGFVGISLFILIIILAFSSNRRTQKLTRGNPDYLWAHDMAKTFNTVLIVYLSGGMFVGVGFLSFQYDMAAVSVGLFVLVSQQVGVANKSVAKNVVVQSPPLFGTPNLGLRPQVASQD